MNSVIVFVMVACLGQGGPCERFSPGFFLTQAACEAAADQRNVRGPAANLPRSIAYGCIPVQTQNALGVR
jgi:hypothetical protein